MKKHILSLVVLTILSSLPLGAVVPSKVSVPDIPGYVTLKGDFHVHTMFSDATTWPTDRVDEALYEGLDFLSITDHVENNLAKQVNAGILDKNNVDKNTSYKIASSYAKGKDFIVIHGGESSRGLRYFPAHFNTHFISDGNAVCEAGEAGFAKYPNDPAKAHEAATKEGLMEAKKQGAFIVWNHPQWQYQAPNGVKWLPLQEWAYKNGYMQGIEIVNQDCSDLVDRDAFHWAMEKGLTVVSGTDCHAPMYKIVDNQNQMFRAMTLVFATEKSEAGIRDALDHGRTLVFADEHLFGPEQYLAEMFKSLFKVIKVTKGKDSIQIKIRNDSSIPIIISKDFTTHKEYYIGVSPYKINRGEEVSISFYTVDKSPIPDTITVDLIVNNFWKDVDTPLRLEYQVGK